MAARVIAVASLLATAAAAPCAGAGCASEESEEAGLLQAKLDRNVGTAASRKETEPAIVIFTTGGSYIPLCGKCPDETRSDCGVNRKMDNRTLQMAVAVQEGALEYCPTCRVDLIDIRFNECPDYKTIAATYDGIIVGAPDWQGLPTPDMVAYTSEWSRKGFTFACKVGAAFATAGHIYAGLENTIRQLHARLMTFQMLMVGGPDWTVNPGAGGVADGAWKTDKGDSRAVGGPETYTKDTFAPLDDMFLSQGKALGYRVATVTKAAKASGLTDGSLCEAYPGGLGN